MLRGSGSSGGCGGGGGTGGGGGGSCGCSCGRERVAPFVIHYSVCFRFRPQVVNMIAEVAIFSGHDNDGTLSFRDYIK